MKERGTVKIGHVILALSVTATTFAANKGSMHLSSSQEVAGQRLAPGDYVVRWEDSGPNVELKIMQGKRVAATATAYVISREVVSPNNAVLLNTDKWGHQSLSEIFFAGKKIELEIRSALTDLDETDSR